MFNRILVVCTGNICRSPVAEALLKQALPDKQISSAGLGAVVGEGVEPKARVLAENSGLEVRDHVSRQLTPQMLSEADLVLVMSEGQRQAVGRMAPEAMGKTMRLGHWLKSPQGESGVDIADPFRKSEEYFALIHEQLEAAVNAWLPKLGVRSPKRLAGAQGSAVA